jgi:probable HAF family extracellular repeat protein
MPVLRPLVLTILLVFFTYLCPAMAVDIIVLGTLAGGTYSYTQGISGDGKIVVGSSDSTLGTRAFRYSATEGMADLGVLPNGTYSQAKGASYSGDTVVGDSSTGTNNRAFRWTSVGGMEDLGTLGGNDSGAYDVSDNGDIIVGFSSIRTNPSYSHAFRWVNGQGMQDLGTLGGNYSQAYAVSSDGSIVVGSSENASGFSHAFRWVNGQGMQDLGTLGGNYSQAYAVSGDGKIIVGGSDSFNSNWQAFRWDEAKGIQKINPYNSNFSTATGITQDGKVIIGNYDAGAFLWDESNNMSSSVWSRLQAQGANLTGWDPQMFAANGPIGGDINNLSITGQGMYYGNWTSFLITNFNATVAPEPSAFILTGIAALTIGAYTIIKRKNNYPSLDNISVYSSNATISLANLTFSNQTILGNLGI